MIIWFIFGNNSIYFNRLEERTNLSSQKISQLENKVRELERDKLTTTVDKDNGFVVDICSEMPNLSEVTHELSAVKFELTKLHSLLQQKERELTEVRVNSENVAVAANLENSKQVGLDVFLNSYIHTKPNRFAIPKII